MLFPDRYEENSREAMIVELILAEVRRAKSVSLYIPFPRHERLQRLCHEIIRNPTDNLPLDDYARIACLGRRTLTRLFRSEMGMSLFDWRQEVRLLSAVSSLRNGQPITTVAYDVGYASPSSFTVAFRKRFGTSPSHYLAKGGQSGCPGGDMQRPRCKW